jgi:hypothetical protein
MAKLFAWAQGAKESGSPNLKSCYFTADRPFPRFFSVLLKSSVAIFTPAFQTIAGVSGVYR